ncbi:relaxin receptor 2-like [Paramacrobiotus metropolitanus]|uniref:relaxin receptor 2-like n=1 Tax=Paramacrobiotus metropolitanus TaxID=2943436 RepID=UPI002446169A|nr:relaxin receptor 2-like [Paramacrobiotus metropolitanus]
MEWILIITTYATVVLLGVSSGYVCPPQEHPCGDTGNTCVHQRLWCDDWPDCPNGRDEQNCSHSTGMWNAWADWWDTRNNDSQTMIHPLSCDMDEFPEGCNCSYSSNISCADQNITDIPQNIRPGHLLTKFNLARNQITSLPDDGFRHYTSVVILELTNNLIQCIGKNAFNGLEKLNQLWLSNNHISALEPGLFQNVPNLQLLFLAGNGLTDWDPQVFSGKHAIKWMDVRNNRLRLQKKDMLRYLHPYCQWLEFDDNLVEYLDQRVFQHIRSFQVISFANNNIQTLAEDTFAELNLSELILSNNSIQVVPANIFANQTLLRDIDLSGNPIHYLPETLFDGLDLAYLKLGRVEIRNISKRMFANPKLKIEHITFDKFRYCGYAPRVKDCRPKTDGISSAEHLLDSPVLQSFSWLIGVVALFANGFVFGIRVYLWRGSSQLSKIHSLSILSLALSDSMMGFYTLIIAGADANYENVYYKYSHRWVRSHLCRFSGSLAVISSEVSTLLLVFMAVERYARLVRKPIGRSGIPLRRIVIWIILCWIVGTAIGIIPLSLDLNIGEVDLFYSQNGVCLPLFIHEPYQKWWWMSFFMFVITPLLSVIVICLCYYAIFDHVEQSRQDSERSRADKTHLRKVLAITISNNISWAVVIAIKILALLGTHLPAQIYGWVAVFVLPVNCCLNPIIYTAMTPHFKGLLPVLSTTRSRTRAEAKAIQQIVYCTSGFNTFSRHNALRRSFGQSSTTTLSTRVPLSQQNSFIGLSRTDSKFTPRVSQRLRKVKSETPIRQSLLHQRDNARITKCVNNVNNNGQYLSHEVEGENEDEGIVMCSLKKDVATGTPMEWDSQF